MRTERDFLGAVQIEDECYYGVHTLRAKRNFDLSRIPVHPALIRALATVKKAAALANQDAGLLDDARVKAITAACDEIIAGRLDGQFVVDAMQGGAGTSTNMNVNEVVANRAIELLGGRKGEYHIVHPLDHVNLSQSTNDVYPTAVRIAAIDLLKLVSEAAARLQSELQRKEEEFSGILKVGRTQLQDAVPVTLGQEFGAWAQAVARDRWRLYKVEERLRQVSIGGTAVGTGTNAPKKYIFSAIERLRELTGMGLARAEYMMDPTQNADVFVEVSGLLKAAAVNLSKIAHDLRLLASGPRAGLGEIRLPAVQAGSSIMPGKVNPVIAEAVNQAAFQIMADDFAITIAAQSGQLELNAFLPLIAKNLLEMLDLIYRTQNMFIEHCITGIQAVPERCAELAAESFVTVTALVDYIGYDRAAALAKKCLATGQTVREAVLEDGLMEEAQLDRILNTAAMTSPGIPGRK